MSENTETLVSELVAIRVSDLPYVQDKIAKMAKRAKRSGAVAPHVEVCSDFQTRENKGTIHEPVWIIYDWHMICAVGQRPKLDGWAPIANLVRVGEQNVVRSIIGESIPEMYETRHVCDHCGTRRQRKETWLFRHDTGTLAQVGKNCCQDYVGTTKVDLVSMTLWAQLSNELSGNGVGNFGERTYTATVDFLAATSAICREIGWTSRGRCTDERPATAIMAGAVLWNNEHKTNTWLKQNGVPIITAKDWQTAKDALVWIADADVSKSDYLRNCQVAASSPVVLPKLAGLLASIVGAAMPNAREQASRAQRDRGSILEAVSLAAQSEYQGEIKERITREIEVTGVRSFDGEYGVTTLIKMSDKAHNVYQWWASGEKDVEVGAKATLVGTVKAHKVGHPKYDRGAQMTILNRCKGL